YKAEPMTVKIDDPLKSSDGSYVTYRVFTMTALPNYSVDNRPVRRRFRDFVWLHNALTLEFPTSVIPPLPEKHRLKYMKGDRFNPVFIEHRRLCLQWFMDRVSRHPLLQASNYTRLFLESTDFTLVKVKKPDEKFVEMRDSIDKFEDNLNIVEKLYHRIGKRQQELEQNYGLFANSIRGLSGLETNVDQPLRQFAEATESYVDALRDMRKQEDLFFLNDVHELINYCHATKDQLIERDQKQVNFEEVSTALQNLVLERERLLYPSKPSAASGSMNITDIMQDKMSDNGKARNERLQEEVTKTNDTSNKYSNQMIKEYEVFKKAKEIELKQGFAAYADCHIDFYKKSISIWENILPILDQIQLEEI
ncbi:MAG: Phox homologous domain-containing protein, partial [Benjaminiella poitrasii]